MKTINLDKYGPILGSRTAGEEIYTNIKKSLDNEQSVTIELSNIKSMATFCAKQIFGKLYIELGSSVFFDRIILKGADSDLKTIIQIGIQNALEDKA